VTDAHVLPEGVVTAPPAERDTARTPGKWDGLRRAPISRRGLIVYLLAYVTFTLIAIGVGLLIVHELGGVRSLDDRVARWFARNRTDTLDAATWLGSGSAEALVKISVTVVASLVFVWRWRRWSEPALLAGALVLEVMVFITSSFVVDRGRPPVSQLDSVPPTSSFPSGHTAAAIAFYGALAIIVFWHTRNRIARGVALTAAILLPPIVGVSRLYRGMHHLSDVIVGAIIGLASLCVVYRIVEPRWRDSMSRPPRRQAPGTSTATMVHRSFTEPDAFTTTGDPPSVGRSTR
jgi:membrane-associated phospholipid phosphatase